MFLEIYAKNIPVRFSIIAMSKLHPDYSNRAFLRY